MYWIKLDKIRQLVCTPSRLPTKIQEFPSKNFQANKFAPTRSRQWQRRTTFRSNCPDFEINSLDFVFCCLILKFDVWAFSLTMIWTEIKTSHLFIFFCWNEHQYFCEQRQSLARKQFCTDLVHPCWSRSAGLAHDCVVLGSVLASSNLFQEKLY